ncbi:MAG: hypothetical protein AzoDbin1_03898 [Azoarcus sp.]|nr:hypothetical protein [Azoarcus sp.]
MEATLIHPDCIVKHAERRAARAVLEAEAVAQNLRRNHIDWLHAFNRISDMQSELNAVCFILEAILDDFENLAPPARDKVEAIRLGTGERLQALQAELRATCLFNGPTAVANRSAA